MPDDIEVTDDTPSPGGKTDLDILKGDDEDVSDEESTDESTDEEGQEEDEEEGEEDESEDTESDDDESDDDGTDESEEESDDDVDEESDDEEAEEEGAPKNLYQALKKDNPEIFKKHPELRGILHREKQFSEVFSTPEEAKAAFGGASTLNAMWQDIETGEPKKLAGFMSVIKKTNPDAYENFAHNILGVIAEDSKELYGEVLERPIKLALKSYYLAAKQAGNNNGAVSAKNAYRYFFGPESQITEAITGRQPKSETKEAKELKTETEKFWNDRGIEFTKDIEDACTHSLRNSIKKSLVESNVKLEPYIEKKVIDDIFIEVGRTLSQDSGHLKSMDSLFAQARSARLSKDWKTKIITAYLGRAKSSLTAVKSKVLKEAGIKFSKINGKEVRRITPGGFGSGALRRNDEIDFSKVDRKHTTDMDLLKGTPKYKK